MLERTQGRLSSGKKVNTALDNPTNFFTAQAHTNRAADLDSRKDGMGEAIQAVKAANAGISGVQALIESARGLAQSALSANATDRSSLSVQFDAIRTQIDQLASDSGYKGTNLLDNGSLEVIFNEGGTAKLTIGGFTSTSTGLGITASTGNWANTTDIQGSLDKLSSALGTLRTQSKTLASNLNVVQTRADFTTGMINTLTEGANKLTAADMNEEGANMLMLQTRQSLSTTALSLSAQAAQSVLQLF
jgi:flagellin-like hook-associated protein FlgL